MVYELIILIPKNHWVFFIPYITLNNRRPQLFIADLDHATPTYHIVSPSSFSPGGSSAKTENSSLTWIRWETPPTSCCPENPSMPIFQCILCLKTNPGIGFWCLVTRHFDYLKPKWTTKALVSMWDVGMTSSMTIMFLAHQIRTTNWQEKYWRNAFAIWFDKHMNQVHKKNRQGVHLASYILYSFKT